MNDEFVRNLIYNNMKPIFALVILLIIVVVFIIGSIISFIYKIFGGYKEIELGPFKLKGALSKKDGKENITEDSLKFNNTSISVNAFIGIFETLLNAELRVIIKNCINISEKINKYQEEFSKYANDRINIFTTNIKHEYYSKLIKLVEELQLNSDDQTGSKKIKDTKEFNFISELLFTFEHKFTNMLKTLVENEEIEPDYTGMINIPSYTIENIKTCIFTCEDPIKLNETRFDNKVFRKTIIEVNDNLVHEIQIFLSDVLENKKRMITKQQREMNNMDDITNKSISNIINGVLSKLFNHIDINNTSIVESN